MVGSEVEHNDSTAQHTVVCTSVVLSPCVVDPLLALRHRHRVLVSVFPACFLHVIESD